VIATSLVPLSWTLAPALRTGAAVRRLHGQLDLLGAGWTGKIQHAAEAGQRSGPQAWEQTRGLMSTLRLRGGRTVVALELEPIGCPGGRQRIVVRSPDATVARTLLLRPGFHWYQIGLSWVNGGTKLTLTLRCLAKSAAPRGLKAPLTPVAVAIAGLAWSDPP